MRHALTFVAIMLLSFGVFARIEAAQRPEHMLKNATDDIIKALEVKKPQLKSDPDIVVNIVERVLLPHIDSMDMARWVIGRNHWTKASGPQRTAFAKEFVNLLVRTYASSLRTYDNQTVSYRPLRGEIAKKSRVQVHSVIHQPGQADIHLAYRLVRKGDRWKVYDIIIEGVSLLKGFQAQFENDVKQLGIEQLTINIRRHNQRPL